MIRYFNDLEQGSDEWLAARCGLITASEVKLILTPTLKAANNDKSRAHFWELLAQRISRYVEPRFVTDDMLRGQVDEIEARSLYEQHYAPVQEVGFITNDRWGFTIGYSPDGLVGDDGAIECKSRRQRFQVETILRHIEDRVIPEDFILQVQTGLLVSEREWIDLVSYSGGLPLVVIRAYPDPKIQNAILEAASGFEQWASHQLDQYRSVLSYAPNRLIPTERKIEVEMFA